MSDGCKQGQLLCPNCQVLHVACHSNSMYPAALEVTRSVGEKEREPLMGLHADRQGLCAPNMRGAGGQIEFLAGFQSRKQREIMKEGRKISSMGQPAASS